MNFNMNAFKSGGRKNSLYYYKIRKKTFQSCSTYNFRKMQSGDGIYPFLQFDDHTFRFIRGWMYIIFMFQEMTKRHFSEWSLATFC